MSDPALVISPFLPMPTARFDYPVLLVVRLMRGVAEGDAWALGSSRRFHGGS